MPARSDRAPLPRYPQPLEQLRRRYPAALAVTYDAAEVAAGRQPAPYDDAACVFDHEDGLRLIVSRERLPGGLVWLHVSASFPEDCPLGADFRVLYAQGWDSVRVYRGWLRSIPRRFALLSGDERPLAYVGLSEGLIPHWAIREEEPTPCAM